MEILGGNTIPKGLFSEGYQRWNSPASNRGFESMWAQGGTHPCLHECQGPLRIPDQPHAVMNPTRPQPALSDLKASARAQKYVLLGHTHVLELYFTMAT